MPASRDILRSADQRALPFRCRRDLQIVRVAFAGQDRYVVRDPVSQDVFQLTPQEHALFERLKSPATLRSLQREFERQFSPLRVTAQHIQQLIQRLYQQGLLLSQQPGQGSSLFDRGRRRSRAAWLLRSFQLLAIRLGGVAPGRAVDVMAAAFGWLFSPLGSLLAGLLAVLASTTAIAHSNQLLRELPGIGDLFAPRTLPLWIAAVAAVKVLHELGHAIACQRFGARCQEIGVLLLAGFPTLYCDVSDAWRLPNKWRRMAISAAGMYVELIVAAVALLVWRFTHPGPAHAICMSLIVVCSVGTLLVNANPLLRYDGYYLLSDLLETPNLSERSRRLWTDGWRRWLLGQRSPVDPLLGPSKRAALRVYALVSKVYVALILAGVLAMLLRLARPHHLENAVYTVAAVAAVGLLLQPAASVWRLLKDPLTRQRLRKGRLVAMVGVAAAILAVLFAWPITDRVTAPIVVTPARSFPLFAASGGALQYAAAPGSKVRAGDVVVQLRDVDSELAIRQQEGLMHQRKTRLEQLQTLRAVDPSLQRLIPAARAELADANARLSELRTAAQALTIRAAATGVVLAPPSVVSDAQRPETLPSWSGTPLDAANQGAWIEPGAALAVVAAGQDLMAWAAVDQSDVGQIESGQSARLMTEQAPTKIFTGTVTQVSRRAQLNRPSDQPASRFEERRGEGRYHVVQIAIDDSPQAMRSFVGARGRAKIQTHRSTLLELLVGRLRKVWRTSF